MNMIGLFIVGAVLLMCVLVGWYDTRIVRHVKENGFDTLKKYGIELGHLYTIRNIQVNKNFIVHFDSVPIISDGYEFGIKATILDVNNDSMTIKNLPLEYIIDVFTNKEIFKIEDYK